MRTTCVIIGGLLASGLLGCGTTVVRKDFLNQPPRRVAVLPFLISYNYDLAESQTIPESHQQAREMFRKTFYENFTPYGFDDMALDEVDAKLAAAWGSDSEAWRRHAPQELGLALGVDAVISGDITRLVNVATPAYTHTSIDATLRMIDTRSGEELWRTRTDVAERGGATMQKGQVVDFLQDQARSFHPEEKFQRVADTAARKALAKMPNPPMSVESTARSDARADASMSIAILPFTAKSKNWQKPATSLRMGVAGHFSKGPFRLVELQRVDAAVAKVGGAEGAELSEAQVLQVAHMVHADLLLRGTVTKWGRTYLGIESWVKAAMSLELMDAATGDVVWSGEKHNIRTAGITKGPTGLTSIVTGPIKGMKTSHLNRVGMDLTRQMVADILKAPEVQVYVNRATQSASTQ